MLLRASSVFRRGQRLLPAVTQRGAWLERSVAPRSVSQRWLERSARSVSRSVSGTPRRLRKDDEESSSSNKIYEKLGRRANKVIDAILAEILSSDKLGAPKEIVDASLRGVGQVVFANSPKSGLVILLGLGLGSPLLAAFAGGGSLVSTFAASRYADVRDGVYGYNGCLVGCAMCVFVPMAGGSMAEAGIAATAGAAVSPFVMEVFKQTSSVPQWTLAFNLVTLAHVARLQPLAPSSVEPVAQGAVALGAPLAGVAQIFLSDSSITGLGILAGVGLLSPLCAAHALGGSIAGTGLGCLMSADPGALTAGLYGYNAALTSLAAAVFFVDTPQSRVLSAGAALTATCVYASMATNFGNVPCMTLPFCAVASGTYLLGRAKAVPGLRLAHNPQSPETNREH